jgi:hypothetical protein
MPELLDPRLDVVTGDPLPGGDRLQVDVVDDCLVRLDDTVGHLDAELALGPEHREPQSPLEHDLVLRRPQVRELGAGVAVREDVGDHRTIVPDHRRHVHQRLRAALSRGSAAAVGRRAS